jgi:hypothetical protein
MSVSLRGDREQSIIPDPSAAFLPLRRLCDASESNSHHTPNQYQGIHEDEHVKRIAIIAEGHPSRCSDFDELSGVAVGMRPRVHGSRNRTRVESGASVEVRRYNSLDMTEFSVLKPTNIGAALHVRTSSPHR